MPNKEGGYGGYRQSPQRGARKVRAPGAEGGVRRGVTPPGAPAVCAAVHSGRYPGGFRRDYAAVAQQRDNAALRTGHR